MKKTDKNSQETASLPKVFGLPIEQLPLSQDGVPAFVPVVRDYICSNAEKEGIFRKCGSHTMIQDLGTLFMCPVCSVPPSNSVYEVSGFLKQWLK